jgi:hypothetical protein
MPGNAHLPLTSLLSQALVAYTVELDNAFEARMPHRTTRYGGKNGPWLVSLAMYENCMRYVDETGITPEQLAQRALMQTKLKGMLAWGYVTIEDGLIRSTLKGARARTFWRDLLPEIDQRWHARYGDAIVKLRESLTSIVQSSDIAMPDYLPILGVALRTRIARRVSRDTNERMEALPISALLARVLTAFTLVYERDGQPSLAISANVLRLTPVDGIAVTELERKAGVSKEAIAFALSFLSRNGHARLQRAAGSRLNVLVLNESGLAAKREYGQRIWEIEKRAQARTGKAIDDARAALEAILPELPRGLDPPADGWRAKVSRPEGLPHQPMVLHRGGFPDGA